MRSIVIVGAGELGGALARQLAAADVVSTVLLVDAAGRVAEGKALDLRQSAPIDAYTTEIKGTTEESAVVGCDVVVIADQAGAGGAGDVEWQDDQGVALLSRIAYLNQSAMLVCAGGRQLALVERGVRELGISRQRLFGTAPEALRAAIISMTALEASCTPQEVSLTVVGRPPGQIIVPWEAASVGGRRASDALSPPALTRLDARLSRLWPPGPLTLASAATRAIAAAATRSAMAVSAFVAVSATEGDRGRVGMLPITLSPRGVGSVLAPTLSTRDRVRLDTALQR